MLIFSCILAYIQKYTFSNRAPLSLCYRTWVLLQTEKMMWWSWNEPSPMETLRLLSSYWTKVWIPFILFVMIKHISFCGEDSVFWYNWCTWILRLTNLSQNYITSFQFCYRDTRFLFCLLVYCICTQLGPYLLCMLSSMGVIYWLS